uniref:(northern house mosquito) hypothetical protein n=1 Tax=Culex pipiens TaxID=7175 RepID=A0A8D8I5P6_CULPI
MIRQFHSNLMPSTHPPAAVRPRAQTLRQRNVIHRVRLRVHDPDLLRPRRRLATLDSGGAVLGDSLHHDALRMLLESVMLARAGGCPILVIYLLETDPIWARGVGAEG